MNYLAMKDEAKEMDVEEIWKAIEPFKPQQKKKEFVELLQLMKLADIKSVLEIGYGSGGSHEAFLLLGLEVLSVTLPVEDLTIPSHHNVIEGNSTDKETVSLIKNISDDTSFDMVFIDGGHTYKCAKSDYDNYGYLANKMIVFDDMADSEYHRSKGKSCEVYKLWNELKESVGAGKQFKSSVEMVYKTADPRMHGGIGVIYK